jgi:hypothetical protein
MSTWTSDPHDDVGIHPFSPSGRRNTGPLGGKLGDVHPAGQGTLSKNRRDVEFRTLLNDEVVLTEGIVRDAFETSTTTGVSWISKRDETNIPRPNRRP